MMLFKKRLHKKVLVCNGLPFTETQFYRLFDDCQSDFIQSLKLQYQTYDKKTTWEKYKKIALEIQTTLEKCSSRGADIINDFDYTCFNEFNKYEIIVILAHHSDQSNDIEFNGKMFSEFSFTKYFPSDFEGTLDLTSCHSTGLQYALNSHCSSEFFHSIGTEGRTPLPFRLILLQKIVDELCHKDNISYFQAYENSFNFLFSLVSDGPSSKKIVYLGGKMKSTVYAPSEAQIGQSFIVQVFIHNESDFETVELMAKTVDDNAILKNTKSLPFKLKKNEKIEFELSWQNNGTNDFTTKKKRKSLIWTNEPSSVEYVIQIQPDCISQSFIGKIKIAVNKQPVGDIVFKTNIIAGITASQKISEMIDFVPYDKLSEKTKESILINSKINEELEALLISMNKANSDIDRKRLGKEMEMCKKLSQIINSNPSVIDSNVIKVFISSTSDMQRYREILKNQILNLKMFPVSYDTWSQEDSYPRDVCCQQVMASQIFVCLLGANYGFVEPEWRMSMTEIEYRVAVKSGIPILVYIADNYEDKMKVLLPEKEEAVARQKALIDELSSKRLVELFGSDLLLQLKSCEELTRLKTQIENGITIKP